MEGKSLDEGKGIRYWEFT